jgi:hypothetical protein
VGSVLAELGLRDLAQAVVVAYERGLVRVGDRRSGAGGPRLEGLDGNSLPADLGKRRSFDVADSRVTACEPPGPGR